MPTESLGTGRASMAGESITVIGSRNGLELAIQRRAVRSHGKIITQASSSDLITGVSLSHCNFF
jgi:hypothetical protein